MMKTLVINGSPHMDGESMTLFNEMRKKLKGEIDIISAYRENIRPCIDCRHCWKHDECAIKDGMQKIYDKMNEYDNVVLVSPMHFTELSAMLLAVASRFQMYWCAEFFRKAELIHKKKNGVLILTGGGNLNTAKPLSTAKSIFRHINTELIGHVFSMKTNEQGAADDEAALKEAGELAERLNELYENNVAES